MKILVTGSADLVGDELACGLLPVVKLNGRLLYVVRRVQSGCFGW